MVALTSEDVQAFAGTLSSFGGLSTSELESALRMLRVRELARGECLLRAGDRAHECAVVVSGLLREYFVSSRGVERTKSFVGPNEVTGSFADLLSGGASRAFIVAEQRSRLVVASWEALRQLTVSIPAWEQIVRTGTQRLLLRKAEREYELLCLDAEERYAAFRERSRDLEARVAARHVASYLGITPVHLSRLRRRRVRTSRA